MPSRGQKGGKYERPESNSIAAVFLRQFSRYDNVKKAIHLVKNATSFAAPLRQKLFLSNYSYSCLHSQIS